MERNFWIAKTCTVVFEKIYGLITTTARPINDFSDVCLNKLKQCNIRFKVLGAQFESKYLEKEIRTLKRKRFFEKYGMTVFGILFFAVIIYLNFLLGHFDDF